MSSFPLASTFVHPAYRYPIFRDMKNASTRIGAGLKPLSPHGAGLLSHALLSAELPPALASAA